ncbi:MAG: hypothetical protein WC618_05685 [Patescibacteria group bacterium]
MNKFEKYIKNLADHEAEKSKSFLNSRMKILVHAGIRLNWLGDYLANPKIKFRRSKVAVDKVLFTGSSLDWNRTLVDKCHKSVKEFRQLVKQNPLIKSKFVKEASYGAEPILLRGPDDKGLYRVFDGMHRFVGAVIKNKKSVLAYVAANKPKQLPVCEAHVVYDLIRGFQRSARDKKGESDLYHALRLLARTYENVADLLKTRFSHKYVSDKTVQKIIRKVLKDSRKK